MNQTLTYEKHDGIAKICFKRAEIYNPLDQDSLPELLYCLNDASNDSGVGCVILTGEGKAFSAGGNVTAMINYARDPNDLAVRYKLEQNIALLNKSVLAIRQLPKPVICVLNGIVAGGALGLMAASDMILAHQNVRFIPAYLDIGLSPDAGSSLFFHRLLGPWRASEIFMMGEAISAETALSYGLINRIVPQDSIDEEAINMANKLLKKSSAGLARTKEVLNACFDNSLSRILEIEKRHQSEILGTSEFHNCLQDFQDRKDKKRKG